MSATYSSSPMIKALSFPFKDEKWVTKLLILMGVNICNLFIPVIPSIIYCGYLFRMMKPVIQNGEEPRLPEWSDFGGMLKDGFRLFATSFIYTFPAIVVGGLGMLAYFGTFLAISIAGESGSMSEGVIMPLAFGAMLILFLSMFFTMVWMIVVIIALPPAMGRVVETESFAGAFQFSAWWKVFKANLGGFIIAAIVVLGLYMVITFVGYLFYLSLVLFCLMYVVLFIGTTYLSVAAMGLYANVYREGLDKLTGKA